MEYYEIIQLVILIVAMLTATVYDRKTMKIPNYITFGLMAIGVVYTAVFQKDILLTSMGASVILFFVGSLNLLGMGDIKLLMGVTCLCGWQTMLTGLLVSCIACIMHRMYFNAGEVLDSIKNLKQAVVNKDPIKTSGKKAPFAFYIATGSVFAHLIINTFALTEGLF